MLNKTDRCVSWMTYLAFALPVLIYLYAFQRYATNMPYVDDYDAILNWTLLFYNTHDFQGKFFLFFRQHNEHRIIIDYFANLLSMGIFHRIDFVFISFVGSIGLFGITAVMLFIGRRNRLSIYELIPIPFLLLCLSQNQLISGAMTGVQQYWQLLFDILAILLLTISRSKAGFALACLLEVMATFSGGGGLLVFPVGLVYLILSRKFLFATIWLIVTGVTLYLFFIYFKYQPSPYGPEVHAYFLAHPFNSVVFVLGFLGNAAQPQIVAIGVGVLFLAAMAAMIAVDLRKRDATLLGMALFLFISAVVVAQNRALMGGQTALSSRYTIYGLLILAVLYLLVMSSVEGRQLRRFLSFAGILVAVFINICWISPSLATMRFYHNFEKTTLLPEPDDSASALMQEAMRQNIFFPVYMYRHLPPAITNNKQYYHAWCELFSLYISRRDLEQAFPLGAAASYKPLLEWAVSVPDNDPDFNQLAPYQPSFRSMLGVFQH